MAKSKVFVFAPAERDRVGDTLDKLVAQGCELVQGDADWHNPMGNNEDEMCAFAENADALMGTSIRSSPISRRIMEAAEDLRIVAKYTIGVDDVDVDAATDMGILVTHSPTESNWGGVAEGAFAMMLAILKKIRERDEAMKAGEWRSKNLQGTFVGSRVQDGVEGITIGIIGLGRIGRRLATLLAPWRVRILAYDPFVERARFTLHNCIESDLDTVLKESDVITLHVTLNESSRKLIDAKAFAKMKKTCVFINSSRGGAVDEPAMIDALETGMIAAAALDVFEHEPLPVDSRLRKMDDRVLLSAHMVTGNRSSGIFPGAVWAAQCVEKAIKGEVPYHVINPEVLPRWIQRFGGKNLLE
jgi:D-3-phosphoglycerate dehydrogenase